MVEHHLAKVRVAGSNPVFRSKHNRRSGTLSRVPDCFPGHPRSTISLYHPVAKRPRSAELSIRLVKSPVALVTYLGLANPLLLEGSSRDVGSTIKAERES